MWTIVRRYLHTKELYSIILFFKGINSIALFLVALELHRFSRCGCDKAITLFRILFASLKYHVEWSNRVWCMIIIMKKSVPHNSLNDIRSYHIHGIISQQSFYTNFMVYFASTNIFTVIKQGVVHGRWCKKKCPYPFLSRTYRRGELCLCSEQNYVIRHYSGSSLLVKIPPDDPHNEQHHDEHTSQSKSSSLGCEEE